MKVLFVSESGGEHGWYLPVFAKFFAERPQFGVQPQLLQETVAAPASSDTAPLLRRFGLDGHFARSRRALATRIRHHIDQLKGTFDALVINPQCAGLSLEGIGCPIHVCVDATFQQLGRTEWFSGLAAARRLAPSLLGELIAAERTLYSHATTLLPWSDGAAKSLREEYGISADKMMSLPPSVESAAPRKVGWPAVPRGLFFGDDFKRQGGDLLVEAFRRYFNGRIELDLVTAEKVRPQPGIRVFRDARPHTPEWRALWEEADFFLYPSRLETFGAPLLQALALGVPVVASRCGATEEILDNGAAGLLIDGLSVESLASALDVLLGDKKGAIARCEAGRSQIEAHYELRRNCARLATVLRGPIPRTSSSSHPLPQI